MKPFKEKCGRIKMAKLLGLPSLALLAFSLFAASVFLSKPRKSTQKALATEIFGVKIEKNPPQSKLDELAVSTWSKWNGEPSIIPWTFKGAETMYLLKGKVKVSVDGHEGSFKIGAGDLVVFPKGMKITFEVLEAVNKHFKVEEE